MVRTLLALALLLSACAVPLNAPGKLELSVSDYPVSVRAGDTLRILVEVSAPAAELEVNVNAPEDITITEKIGLSFVELSLNTSQGSSGLKEVTVEIISARQAGLATIGFEVQTETRP